MVGEDSDIVYDNTIYNVKVNVVLNKDNNRLEIESIKYLDNENIVEKIEFKNVYNSPKIIPTELELQGKKYLMEEL